MNEENSKRLITLLKVIAIILSIAFFSKIIAFIGSIFASLMTAAVLTYLSITSYIQKINLSNLGIFDYIVGGIAFGVILAITINIAGEIFKRLIPQSQLDKYRNRLKVYSDGEEAIKIFNSSVKFEINDIIDSLTKVVKLEKFSSIYDFFESEYASKQNVLKTAAAHAWLGFIYGSHYYGKFNFELAIENYSKATKMGFDHNLELGRLYFDGGADSIIEIDKNKADHVKAIEHFFSALQGYKDHASTYIGLILRRGTVRKLSGPIIFVNYVKADINSLKTGNHKLLKEAYSYFEKAQTTSAVAKFYLGAMQYLGEGCKQDFANASKNMEDAIDIFFDAEIIHLVEIYSLGKGTQIDYFKALKYSLISKLYGDACDSYAFDAKKYLSSEEIAQAYVEASAYVNGSLYIEYIKIANELNSLKAKEILIDLYKKGYGDFLLPDPDMAYRYIKEASGMNSANALNKLALMYESGDGVEKDIHQAMHYYRLASELGSAEALTNLGINYHHGIGVDIDHAVALNYYLKASESGNNRAKINAAYIYLNKNENIDDALNMLSEVANDSSSTLYAEANSTLGQLYADGNLVVQDYSLAFKFLSKSGEFSDSFGRLGKMYYFGLGVDRDLKISRLYLEQYLSSNRDAYCEFLLGWIYYYGEGVVENIDLAIPYLEKSASMKMKDSIFLLSEIYSGEKNTSYKDLVQSLKWLYFAADNNFTDAYEKMKPIKDNLSSEGIEKAKELALTIAE